MLTIVCSTIFAFLSVAFIATAGPVVYSQLRAIVPLYLAYHEHEGQ